MAEPDLRAVQPAAGLPAAGAELVTWPFAGALALWLGNDHLGKGWGPGWLTGKLSDVAGLFCFPLLLMAVARLAVHLTPPRARRLAVAAAALTAASFAAVKLSPRLAQLLSAFGPVRADPTDLWTLPAAALAALWYARWTRRARRSPARGLRLVALGLGLLATAATTQVPSSLRPLPLWSRSQEDRAFIGCARVEAWVGKSGKQGLGITVAMTAPAPGPAPGDDCSLRLERAVLRIAGRNLPATASLPLGFALAPGQIRHHYLPFVFDNDSAWRRGQRGAQVELDFTAQGRTVRWTLPLVQRLPGENLRGDDGTAAPDASPGAAPDAAEDAR